MRSSQVQTDIDFEYCPIGRLVVEFVVMFLLSCCLISCALLFFLDTDTAAMLLWYANCFSSLASSVKYAQWRSLLACQFNKEAYSHETQHTYQSWYGETYSVASLKGNAKGDSHDQREDWRVVFCLSMVTGCGSHGQWEKVQTWLFLL